jgi:hypothetical protein
MDRGAFVRAVEGVDVALRAVQHGPLKGVIAVAADAVDDAWLLQDADIAQELAAVVFP